IVGDRGPSALDWAIMRDCPEWGVTVLQANGEMDAGDIWAAETFRMRLTKKSSLYRDEVSDAAVRAVLAAVGHYCSGNFKPQPLDYSRPDVRGRLHAPIRQADRAIDWNRDDTRTVLKKIHAADGFPGVHDTLCGEAYYLFDACAEDTLRGTQPGAIIAKRNGAICRATLDGAVWIGHLKLKTEGANEQPGNPLSATSPPPARGRDCAHSSNEQCGLKLPAVLALGEHLADVPEAPLDLFLPCTGETCRDIWFEQKNDVGYLHFDFYNGAMSSEQCERLRAAYLAVTQRDVRVIVLLGGADFWSNGIHLNRIEAAASPADESWRNINAIDDLARAIVTTASQLTIAALQGNAGAGGVFLSLAADHVYAREGVVFNPHYKGMGNLYGSEYWTYLLPGRVGEARAATLTRDRLPVGAIEAREMGLIDGCFGTGREDFLERIARIAEGLAASPDYSSLLREKLARRERDEREKPLDAYRAEELQQMKLNFYGFDPSYHVARYNFVYKIPHAWTPLYLARHRRIACGLQVARLSNKLPADAPSGLAESSPGN
ncbi:MAG: hydrogenase maturation protein, partial [Gallionella sp.]